MGIRLVVGLGNPGQKYADTRHNLGFLAVERFVTRFGGPEATWRKAPAGEGLVAEINLAGERVRLAKPLTYMNASGDFVGALAAYHKIPPGDILIVSDDMDLPLGRLRIRKTGSSGGQKGLDSILTRLGTRDVPRLRLGIGRRPSDTEGKVHVLGRFNAEERSVVDRALDLAAEAIRTACEKGVEPAMNAYNPEVPEP